MGVCVAIALDVFNRYRREFDLGVPGFPTVLRDLVFSYFSLESEEWLVNLTLVKKCYGDFSWGEGIKPISGPAKTLADRLFVQLGKHPDLIRISSIAEFPINYHPIYKAVCRYLFRENSPEAEKDLVDVYGKILMACSKSKERLGWELRKLSQHEERVGFWVEESFINFYEKTLRECKKSEQFFSQLLEFNSYQNFEQLIVEQLPEALQKLALYEEADKASASSYGPWKKIKKWIGFSPF